MQLHRSRKIKVFSLNNLKQLVQTLRNMIAWASNFNVLEHKTIRLCAKMLTMMKSDGIKMKLLYLQNKLLKTNPIEVS